MTTYRSARLGLICTAAALLIAGQNAVRAQEGVAIKNLLGTLGIVPQERDPIRYRERAPLVLPPKMELREPAGSESFASNNPQWPNDPDVVARRKRAADAAIPVTQSDVRRMSENNPRLSVEELRQGRTARADEPGRHKSDRDGVILTPAEMRLGTKTEADRLADDTSPVRRTLTDPPSVMRQAARGGQVNRSYEPSKVDQQSLDANPMNWLTRAFRSSDDD